MHKNTNFQEAIIILKEKVKNFTNKCFFKGINSNDEIPDIFIIDPKNSNRQSKTKDIHGVIYDILLNNLDVWKKYPLRNSSVILTGDVKIAENFAKNGKGPYCKVFQVFPMYNSEIVIAPENDIWYSFRKGLGILGLKNDKAVLHNFNRIMEDILKSYNEEKQKLTFDSIKSTLQKISKETKDTPKYLDFETDIVYNKLFEINSQPLETLNNIFDPELNGFKIKKFDENFSLENTKSEVWTDSICLLINIESVEKIMSKLK